MAENKIVLPDEFVSVDELQTFWDTHSTADYWDEMVEAHFDIAPELKLKMDKNKLYHFEIEKLTIML